MTTTLDRTQYPISPDALERDLFDIGDKLDMLEEFTDGVEDTHLSPQEHHLVHRQKRLLVLLRDVLEEHRSLLYDTEIESDEISYQTVDIPEVYDNSSSRVHNVELRTNSGHPLAISFRSELSEMSSEMLQKRIFLATFPLPLKPYNAGVGFTEQEKSAITTTAMRLRAYRLGLDCHAYKDEVEENYIKHLLDTGIYTKFSVNERGLSLYLHTRNGTTLELVDVLVKRYMESQL